MSKLANNGAETPSAESRSQDENESNQNSSNTGGTLTIQPPKPDVDDSLYAPFWEGTAEGELRVPECQQCGRILWPVRSICPSCYGTEFRWRTTSTTGHLVTHIVSHRAFHPAWSDRTPYATVLVEVEEGIRMLGNYRGEDPSDLEAGMNLQAVFEPLEDGPTLVQWEPA